MKRILLAGLLCLVTQQTLAAAIVFEVATPDTTNTPNTSGNFTPGVGDLEFCTAFVTGTVENPMALTNSVVAITFTQVGTPLDVNTGAGTLYLFIANKLVASGEDIAQNVSVAPVDQGTGSQIACATITGMTRVGTSAIKQSKTRATTAALDATPDITFDTSVLTGNPTAIVMVNLTNPAGMTQPTGWTELMADIGHLTPDAGMNFSARDSGFTATNVPMGSTTASNWGMLGVEFNTAAVCSGAPTITDVDTDESVTATQTNVVITGTNFCNSGTVTLRDASANSKTLSQDSFADTSIQVDVSGVGAGVVNGLLYGTLTLRVVNEAVELDDQTVSVTVPSGTLSATLSGGLTPLTFDEFGNPVRLFGDPLDLQTTSQVATRNAVGCAIADITVQVDGSLVVDEDCTAFDWDFSRDSLYIGTIATLEWAGDPPIMGDVDIGDHVLAVGLAMTGYDVDDYFEYGGAAAAARAMRQLGAATDTTTDVNGATTLAETVTVDDASVLLDDVGGWIRCGAGGVPVQLKYADPLTNVLGLWSPVTCADNDSVFTLANGAGSVSQITVNSGTGAVSGTPDTDATTTLLLYRVTDADGLFAEVALPFQIDVVTIADVTTDDLAGATTTLEALGIDVSAARLCSAAEALNEVLTQDESSVLWGTNAALVYVGPCARNELKRLRRRGGMRTIF